MARLPKSTFLTIHLATAAILCLFLSSQGNRTLVEQQGELLAGSLRIPYGGQMLIQESPGLGLQIGFLSGLFKDVEGEWRIESMKPFKLYYQMRTWVIIFAQEMALRQKNKGATR